MDWLTNGSKTLVILGAMAALSVMAVKGVLSVETGGLIVSMALAYCGVNLYQNGKTEAK